MFSCIDLIILLENIIQINFVIEWIFLHINWWYNFPQIIYNFDGVGIRLHVLFVADDEPDNPLENKVEQNLWERVVWVLESCDSRGEVAVRIEPPELDLLLRFEFQVNERKGRLFEGQVFVVFVEESDELSHLEILQIAQRCNQILGYSLRLQVANEFVHNFVVEQFSNCLLYFQTDPLCCVSIWVGDAIYDFLERLQVFHILDVLERVLAHSRVGYAARTELQIVGIFDWTCKIEVFARDVIYQSSLDFIVIQSIQYANSVKVVMQIDRLFYLIRNFLINYSVWINFISL